jgi:hypothetical protein
MLIFAETCEPLYLFANYLARFKEFLCLLGFVSLCVVC